MFTIIGFIVVLLSIIGGYLMAHGSLLVLLQPAELIIIGGAAAGSLIAANPPRVLKAILPRVLSLVRGEPYGKKEYLDTLKMLHDLFSSARKNGAARLESDIENPRESPVFTEHPRFLKDHHSLTYLCDTLRMVLMGGSRMFC